MSTPHAFELVAPVVLFVFNRPDTTRLVFNSIRAARPRHLMVVADGPRRDRGGEAELCQETRNIVSCVDWDCQVDTLYSDINQGCMRRISSGLDWVFQQVEEAIILEDDCLPHPTFFRFCQELLEKYRHDERIAQIAGANFQFGCKRTENSYYFSRYNHIWGWASWRRAWLLNDSKMAGWPSFRDSNGLAQVLTKRAEINYWTRILDRIALGEIDTWDFQWTLSCWRHHMITIIPNVNLVSNIGFGQNSTHNKEPQCRLANIMSRTMQFPLVHPITIEVNKIADEYTGRLVYRDLTVFDKVRIVFNNFIKYFNGIT